MPTLQNYHGVYLWDYIPSLPAAVVFTVLFAIITIAHGWKMFSTKMWFCIPFFIGGICEVVGYITRAAAYDATGSLVLYTLQGIFLLLPPVLFAASLYMVYSRIVRAVQGQHFSLIPPRWTTTVFVLGDWACLNIQGGGAGLLAKPERAQSGDYIIVAGLGLQVLVFIAFVVCCLSFHVRFRAHLIETRTTSDVPWQAYLGMLYGTSLAILVRNIYRVVEFIMGQNGYLLQNEWPVYVFDGTLMLLVMIGFYIWYPSHLQPSQRDSMIELRSEGAETPDHRRAEKDSKSAWYYLDRVLGVLFLYKLFVRKD